jgi:hypothetical protein
VAHDRGSGRHRNRCPYGCDDGWEREPGGDIGNVRCPQGCDEGWEYSDPEGFGTYTPWRDQLADKSIDAIVAVATPDVTTEVALACAAAGKPVMATKPLFDHPATIRAPFYVDFWRLWSKVHERVKNQEFGYTRNWRYSMAGSGPLRQFPGLFDYGPHVIAAILDAIPMARLKTADRLPSPDGTDYMSYSFASDGEHVSGAIGNGSPDGWRCIWGQEETPTHIGDDPKDQIVQRMCQSFLNDISEGFVDTRLLDLSRKSMTELNRIREMTEAVPAPVAHHAV